MDDTQLLPCPWCRGEMVETVNDCGWEGLTGDCWFVQCRSCGMQSPHMSTADDARRVFLVVAGLVNDVIMGMASRGTQISDLLRAGQKFMGARREHPPY